MLPERERDAEGGKKKIEGKGIFPPKSTKIRKTKMLFPESDLITELYTPPLSLNHVREDKENLNLHFTEAFQEDRSR